MAFWCYLSQFTNNLLIYILKIIKRIRGCKIDSLSICRLIVPALLNNVMHQTKKQAGNNNKNETILEVIIIVDYMGTSKAMICN